MTSTRHLLALLGLGLAVSLTACSSSEAGPAGPGTTDQRPGASSAASDASTDATNDDGERCESAVWALLPLAEAELSDAVRSADQLWAELAADGSTELSASLGHLVEVLSPFIDGSVVGADGSEAARELSDAISAVEAICPSAAITPVQADLMNTLSGARVIWADSADYHAVTPEALADFEPQLEFVEGVPAGPGTIGIQVSADDAELTLHALDGARAYCLRDGRTAESYGTHHGSGPDLEAAAANCAAAALDG